MCYLLDGSSQKSFVHENLAKTLKLPVLKQETLNVHTFGSAGPKTTKCNVVKIVRGNVWNAQQRIEITAVEIPQVCTAVMKVLGEHIRGEFKKRALQLEDFQLDGADDSELSVLIGADFCWQVMTGKMERLTESLVGLESTFGWTVQGPVSMSSVSVSMSSVSDTACMHVSLDEDSQISKQLHSFWEIESLGIMNDKTESPEDTEALQSFEQTTIFKDGRSQVELPWRRDSPPLPDNFTVAKKRFESLKRKLSADAALYIHKVQ